MNNTIRETWRQRWAERFNNDKLRSIAILLESEDVIDFIEAEIANARREWQEDKRIILTEAAYEKWRREWAEEMKQKCYQSIPYISYDWAEVMEKNYDIIRDRIRKL